MFEQGDLVAIEDYWKEQHSNGWDSRLIPIDELGEEKEKIHKIPWFLSCNRNRYPYWWVEHDNRLYP
jgi:hypothetical protein